MIHAGVYLIFTRKGNKKFIVQGKTKNFAKLLLIYSKIRQDYNYLCYNICYSLTFKTEHII